MAHELGTYVVCASIAASSGRGIQEFASPVVRGNSFLECSALTTITPINSFCSRASYSRKSFGHGSFLLSRSAREALLCWVRTLIVIGPTSAVPREQCV